MNRSRLSAIIIDMPDRTDAPPRTRPELSELSRPETSSPLVPSPGTSPEPRDEGDHPVTQESFRASFSSNQRGGRWEAADLIEIRAFCGEVTLDFTLADLPPSGIVEIDAQSICGDVTIIVPDGAEIELHGTPVLGSIEQHVRKKRAREVIREWVTGEPEQPQPPPSASGEPPYFRIEARAILGVVKVIGR